MRMLTRSINPLMQLRMVCRSKVSKIVSMCHSGKETRGYNRLLMNIEVLLILNEYLFNLGLSRNF